MFLVPSQHYNLPRTIGFEPRISGVGSNRSYLQLCHAQSLSNRWRNFSAYVTSDISSDGPLNCAKKYLLTCLLPACYSTFLVVFVPPVCMSVCFPQIWRIFNLSGSSSPSLTHSLTSSSSSWCCWSRASAGVKIFLRQNKLVLLQSFATLEKGKGKGRASTYGLWCTYEKSVAASLPVWPDWAIYGTLGNFSKPLETINWPKSLTF